jgi:thiol:disulfide interchange protein DsbA
MQRRREFTAGLIGASALGLPLLASAQQKPKEGADYKVLGKRVPTDVPAGKIELVDFFWYSCPHCNAFEPQLEAWSKTLPADVVLRRVPVFFRDDFAAQQRLFYTLEAMGKVAELHAKVFKAIHQDRQPTNRDELILAFAENNGLDKAKFQEIYSSPATAAKARAAAQLQNAFEVEGVPALGIAGRYYTDGSMAGNMPRAIQVAEYLFTEARKSR